MSLKQFLGVAGALAVLGSLPFLVLPEQAIGFFGLFTDDAGLLITRFFGAAFMSFGILLWFVREAIDPDEHRAIFIPMMLCGVLGAAISLLGQISGLVNSWGWVTVVLFSVVALGFGWYGRK